nr:hypothetical protein CFP56_77492 [Quercus suber]
MSHTVRDRRCGGGWHSKLGGVAWCGGWYGKLDGTALRDVVDGTKLGCAAWWSLWWDRHGCERATERARQR